MSWLGRIFGTEKAMTQTVDHLANGLDKLYYSDEEKAEDAASDRSEARKMFMTWMNASQGQNLARRMLALSIVGTWLMMYVISAVMVVFATFKIGDVTALYGASTILSDRSITMNEYVTMILLFYFGAPYMDKFVNKIWGKKDA